MLIEEFGIKLERGQHFNVYANTPVLFKSTDNVHIAFFGDDGTFAFNVGSNFSFTSPGTLNIINSIRGKSIYFTLELNDHNVRFRNWLNSELV